MVAAGGHLLRRLAGVIATNLDGAFSASASREAHGEGGHGGRLIAVTSVHEHQPRVGSGSYDAAKHGIGGLIKTFALELGSTRSPRTPLLRARSRRP